MVVGILLASVCVVARADVESDGDASLDAQHADIAKKLQDPFSDATIVPLQNLTGWGGLGAQNVLNIQPVVPFALGNRWRLLMRPILPVSYTSVPDGTFGLGDLELEPFLASVSGRFTWGVGPILGFPTATDDALGSGKFSAGPSLAFFADLHPVTVSLLVNQQWSYAGDGSRESVSLFQLQPSVNYNLGKGWYAIWGPQISANWKLEGEKWTVPLGGGLGKVFTIAGQKVSFSLEGYANVVRPDGAARTVSISTLSFVFPK